MRFPPDSMGHAGAGGPRRYRDVTRAKRGAAQQGARAPAGGEARVRPQGWWRVSLLFRFFALRAFRRELWQQNARSAKVLKTMDALKYNTRLPLVPVSH